MVDTVKIHGLKEVRRALKQLPKNVRQKELLKSLTPGANLIKKAAQQMAPRGEEAYVRMLRGKEWTHYIGTLSASIAVRNEKKKFNKGNIATKRIGVLHDNKDPNVGAWYWRFVEFGTKKMAARPFLVPAFESMKYAANDAIKKRLLKGVMEQAKRVRGKL